MLTVPKSPSLAATSWSYVLPVPAPVQPVPTGRASRHPLSPNHPSCPSRLSPLGGVWGLTGLTTATSTEGSDVSVHLTRRLVADEAVRRYSFVGDLVRPVRAHDLAKTLHTDTVGRLLPSGQEHRWPVDRALPGAVALVLSVLREGVNGVTVLQRECRSPRGVLRHLQRCGYRARAARERQHGRRQDGGTTYRNDGDRGLSARASTTAHY